MGWAGIETRLGRLEREQARTEIEDPNQQWYDLRVSASCPPDKRVHIRSGIGTPSGRWGFIMGNDFLPYTICDFENQPETQMSLNFTNAGYYLGLLLCYYGEWVAYRSLGPSYQEPVFDNVLGTEVETAAEAEAQIDALLNGSEDWYYYRLPLWAIVLKNDGNAGVDYAIEPVDVVNRGRSYLYRDIRSDGGIFP